MNNHKLKKERKLDKAGSRLPNISRVNVPTWRCAPCTGYALDTGKIWPTPLGSIPLLGAEALKPLKIEGAKYTSNIGMHI